MKLSIITINLNNAEGLRKTLESVVSQTFNDYEYIVIDGGSTDNSISIIREFESYITYWISEQDTGVYNAMNKGILRAKGEYCLFLNSGDYLYSNEVLRDVFSLNLSEDILYGNLFVFDKKGQLTTYEYPDNPRFSFLFECALPHPAMFMKKRLFDKYGLYDESYRIISDWGFYLLSLCKYNCTYKHLAIFISVFSLDGLSSTSPDEVIEKERKDFLSRNFGLFYEDIKELLELERKLKKVKKTYLYKIVAFIRKILGKEVL